MINAIQAITLIISRIYRSVLARKLENGFQLIEMGVSHSPATSPIAAGTASGTWDRNADWTQPTRCDLTHSTSATARRRSEYGRGGSTTVAGLALLLKSNAPEMSCMAVNFELEPSRIQDPRG